MRNLFLGLGAAALTASAIAVPTAADARKHHYRTYYGRGGHTYCTHSGGTTGAVVGGVGGAVVGNSIAGRGNRLLGTVIGGAAGALGGRAIDRANTAHRRCR
ncbi:glycine zipper 2TM domain-containing protein [Sphingomonas sp.]|jgi:outer membrane lipoprotein SlyB|uniref:glycine zipper 2TM domain-containing protein n=1 Tax=Sphingomonas sp. TaxID=28214 RepID=UPI002E36BBF1|nr:glycine zipper 2TM domain-containing protein [Sphingomonas sp.]HEX4695607.1 glycine zipper 2TM domain-containing protein [Sphingomonas sp.]